MTRRSFATLVTTGTGATPRPAHAGQNPFLGPCSLARRFFSAASAFSSRAPTALPAPRLTVACTACWRNAGHRQSKVHDARRARLRHCTATGSASRPPPRPFACPTASVARRTAVASESVCRVCPSLAGTSGWPPGAARSASAPSFAGRHARDGAAATATAFAAARRGPHAVATAPSAGRWRGARPRHGSGRSAFGGAGTRRVSLEALDTLASM